jgi:ABC-type multidrug transport system fused ATPase/permease subunit
MNIFKQIIYYFSVYKKYIGKRLYIVFILAGLAAAVEGFGITMLLPLIAAADVGIGAEGGDPSGISEKLQLFLDFVGVGSSLIGILLIIATIFLIKGCVLFVSHAYEAHLQSQLMREMKGMMFDKYSTMDYGYYTRKNTGHFINIINPQINGLIISFKSYKTFLSTIIMGAVYLATAFVVAWIFAVMAMMMGVIIMFLFRGLNAYVHKLSRLEAEETSDLNKFLVQTIQSFKYLISTAELMHLRNGIMQSIGRLTAYMRSSGFAGALTNALSEPVAIFAVMVVIILHILFVEANLVPIFVSLVLFNRAMGCIMSVQKAWLSTLTKIGSLEIVEKEFKVLDQNQERSGGLVISPLSEKIVFDDVSYAYGNAAQNVLQNINITIPANTTVAFVGESGAGKSTLADMLTLLLRPQSGHIYIDGVAGSEINLESWRKQIGYVSQETVVFHDTVANNIALWKDDYSDAEARMRIERAASMAYADRFVSDLPEGYNTIVGDRGVRLSGGQRQRLFLARELYKNPRLLILDEATSALDSESEKYIQESIDEIKGQMTVVIIAHRLSTIRNADHIYVLDKGRVIEQGGYRELISSENGKFRQMVELQNL